MPSVAGFCSVITGIIVRIGESLLSWSPGVFLYCPQGIIVHKLVLLQFGTDGVVNPLLRLRRIGGP